MMQVLAVFKYATHGFDYGLVVQILAVECDQRRSPIEGFGHARPLVKIHLADLLHKGANLLRHLGFDLRKLGRYDRVLLFEARILDPMIETTALERIMDFPRAVGR